MKISIQTKKMNMEKGKDADTYKETQQGQDTEMKRKIQAKIHIKRR